MVEQSTKAKARLGKKPCSKWVWRPFNNQARKDGLQLSHWIKEEAAERAEKTNEVYPFSKFDKPSRVPTYNRDDYLVRLSSRTRAPNFGRSRSLPVLDVGAALASPTACEVTAWQYVAVRV
jgi:DNA methyltransferase 1-associated protein 1